MLINADTSVGGLTGEQRLDTSLRLPPPLLAPPNEFGRHFVSNMRSISSHFSLRWVVGNAVPYTFMVSWRNFRDLPDGDKRRHAQTQTKRFN